MSKYIPADKLIAEIERLNCPEHAYCLDKVLDCISSLQQNQPEVDLEKEISKWLEDGDITDTRFDDYDDSDIERTARHFYELGFNARKK